MILESGRGSYSKFLPYAFTGFSDLSLFKQRFTSFDPDANLDGIGPINFSDLAIFKSLFGKSPGPSGVVP